MARAPTTADAFNAIAEPQRRQILGLLARGEQSVNHLAHALHVRQPQASKHLRVLREVGLVSVRGEGQHRLYRINSQALKPIHDWVSSFEHLWNQQFDRLAEYLEILKEQDRRSGHHQ